METSESIRNLAAALLKFHTKMTPIVPDVENVNFKTKYASLPHILKSIKQPLLDSELSIVQMPVGKDGLETVLFHGPSGEWIKNTHLMSPLDDTPADVGAAIAYQRRYAIAAVLSLAIADEAPAAGTAATPEGVDDLRPWMEENHYQSCIKRMNAGKKGVVEAAIKAFQMTPKLLEALREAEKKAVGIAKARDAENKKLAV